MTTVTLRSGEVRESGYPKHPGYRVWLEPCPRRLRAVYNDAVIADSTGATYLYETKHLPVYYFPREDIVWEHFTPTGHSTFCPFKGEAHYWSVSVGDQETENVLWGYPDPLPEVPELSGYCAFYWNKVDRWLEEDEEVFVHPRDPYVRIDVLASRRPVEVRLGGEVVARTDRACFLFETGHPTRYYIPREDVLAPLEKTDTVTACPYKGRALHFAVRAGEDTRADVAWSYPDPVPEVRAIQDRICFYTERVDSITVDGRPVPRPATKWSR